MFFLPNWPREPLSRLRAEKGNSGENAYVSGVQSNGVNFDCNESRSRIWEGYFLNGSDLSLVWKGDRFDGLWKSLGRHFVSLWG